MRAKVEHPFHYIKRVFGYDKVRYRGLAINTEKLYLLAGFTSLPIEKNTRLPRCCMSEIRLLRSSVEKSESYNVKNKCLRLKNFFFIDLD
ncbi:hypothetical protein BTJ40_06825 [Microbulbifer sp. A4B17]|nr:hypothetical protein BTJ40_06825 [Microbulbifer sp. A4B17]